MKIICYGELMIDMIAEGRGELSEAERFRRHAGGAAANVAAQIKKLGGDSSFLGKIGDDAFGHYLLSFMNGYGIDTSNVVLDPLRRTTVAFVGLNQDNIPSYLFYRGGGASATISPDDINQERLKECGIVYTSSLMLTVPQVRMTTHWLLKQARDNGSSIAFDLNFRPTAWESLHEARTAIEEMFGLIDLLKINDEELNFLMDRPTDIVWGGQALISRYPRLKVLIITCGEKGAYLFAHGSAPVFICANLVDTVDTTGAGDSYMGAFLYAYDACKGDISRLEEMGRFSAAAAEMTVLSAGTIDAMPERADLEKYCKKIGVDMF